MFHSPLLVSRYPSSALLPFLFWGEGSATKIDCRKKVGTLILTSLLEDLGLKGAHVFVFARGLEQMEPIASVPSTRSLRAPSFQLEKARASDICDCPSPCVRRFFGVFECPVVDANGSQKAL